MKRIIIIFLAALTLTSCSFNSTFGEVLTPDLKGSPGYKIDSDEPVDLSSYSPELRFIYNHLSDWDEVGISLDYVAEQLNLLNAMDFDSQPVVEIFTQYKVECQEQGVINGVWAEYKSADDRINLICNSPETFYGPEIKSNPYNIVVGDNIYTPYWLFTHTVSDYKAAGISPEAVESMIPYYREFGLWIGADTFFEEKLSQYIGYGVSLSLPADKDIWEKGYHVEYAMPAPFDGSAPEDFYSICSDERLYKIPQSLIDIAGSEAYEKYLSETEAYKNDLVNSNEYELTGYIWQSLDTFENLFSFCGKYLGAGADELKDILIDDGIDEETVDKLIFDIYCSNEAGYLRDICGRQVIITEKYENAYFYTPEWLYTWPTDGWEQAMITRETVEDMLSIYRVYPFTDEARAAFEHKLSYFLGHDVSLSIENDLTNLTVGNKAYELNWLVTHNFSQYRAEGIDAEILSEYLERIEPECGDTEYFGYIRTVYEEMINDFQEE